VREGPFLLEKHKQARIAFPLFALLERRRSWDAFLLVHWLNLRDGFTIEQITQFFADERPMVGSI
jgi:hypothetical protein